MAQYPLNITQPDGPPPAAEFMDKVMSDLDSLNHEMKEAGAWVFTGGLFPAHASTVVRTHGGETLVTDGPFAEAKEHVGGFWIFESEDLGEALQWAEKASLATTLPIEVRPFQG